VGVRLGVGVGGTSVVGTIVGVALGTGVSDATSVRDGTCSTSVAVGSGSVGVI